MVNSSGILAFRRLDSDLEFFLVHPGGPFFVKKDQGFWSIPKGLLEREEDIIVASKREFFEETGFEVSGDFIDLGYVMQKGGKKVHCFAIEFDLDPELHVSNTFKMVWPPRSEKMVSFAEVDRGAWFNFSQASVKINTAQVAFLNRLLSVLT